MSREIFGNRETPRRMHLFLTISLNSGILNSSDEKERASRFRDTHYLTKDFQFDEGRTK